MTGPATGVRPPHTARGEAAVSSVAILCPGLGHVARGFESFAGEVAAALRTDGSLDVMVVKGGGEPAAGEIRAPAIRRTSLAAQLWNRLADRTDPYALEQVTFALGALPALVRSAPGALLFSDRELGLSLARLRPLLPGRPRLVFSNGGPASGPFDHLDAVQHVTPVTYDEAIGRGEPAGRHTVLPYGVAMPETLEPLGAEDRAALRRRLGVPGDRPLVLSVAALDRQFKRLDALVDEVARLEERPHLAMLGQPTKETEALTAHAHARLGADGCTLRTVPAGEVSDWYRAADAFVLPSLSEGFGRVLVEAAAHGLPCLAHSGPVQRFVLGELDHGLDLTRPGELAGALRATLAVAPDADAAIARHASVHARFAWRRLAPRYARLIRGERP